MAIDNILKYINPDISIHSRDFQECAQKSWNELEIICQFELPEQSEYWDEIISFVMVRLYKRRQNNAPIQYPKSYIKRAIINAYIDIYRRNQRQLRDPHTPSRSTLSLDAAVNEDQTLMDCIAAPSNDDSIAPQQRHLHFSDLYQHLQQVLYEDIPQKIGAGMRLKKGRDTFLKYSRYFCDFREGLYSPQDSSEKRKFDRQRNIMLNYLEVHHTQSLQDAQIHDWIDKITEDSNIDELQKQCTSKREERELQAQLSVLLLYKYIQTD